MEIQKVFISYCDLSTFQHPQLMSGEDPDERKANALKQSLDYIDIFLDKVSNHSNVMLYGLYPFSAIHHLLYLYSITFAFHQSSYCAGDQLTIADFSILASVTQLEGMDYRITSYP